MFKKLIILITLACLIQACSEKGNIVEINTLDEISLSDVNISDDFWNPRIENNHKVSFPYMLDRYEENGGRPNPKLLEAGAYILHKNPDPELQRRLDASFEKLIDYYMPGGQVREWQRMLNGDLYGAGHFIEASIAYYNATGSEKVLNAARQVADDIHANFGQNKRQEISQHEEVKIALLRLYELTGEGKYMDIARFFLDERGHSHNGRELYGKYAQDHKPVIDQDEAVGHAVRATYLYTPLAHLATLTGDAEYINAADRIWEDAVHKKTYLVGHVGTYRDHESFWEAYELPNLNCWNETCAAIGNVFWNYRMFELHRDAMYIDMMEKILYNAVLSGVSLDGQEYFYQNPLKTLGGLERHPWYGPNCCPPNVARLIASLGKYIYARSNNDFYVNLFIGSEVNVDINEQQIHISQETGYPWEGMVKLTINPKEEAGFTLRIRIPGWTDKPIPGDLYSYTEVADIPVDIKLNGEQIKYTQEKGFAVIERKWQKGDVIELEIDMPVQKVISNDLVADNAGMTALQRGPVVYCAEGVDNNNNILNLWISDDAEFTALFDDDLLGGVTTVTGNVKVLTRGEDKVSIEENEHKLTAIPYYAWANREPSAMSVWLASDKSRVILPPVPSIASMSGASSSCGQATIEDNYPGGNVPTIAQRFYPSSQAGDIGFKALYDQVEPVNSFDGSSTYLRLRPQNGDNAWVQYDFDKEYEISEVSVYWKDDKQYCRLPRSWNLEYKAGDIWMPVKNITEYTMEKDRFNRVTFEPVRASALRMNIKLNGLEFKKGELGPPDGNYMPEDVIWYECGIIEWIVK
ncbi:MAG: glycoside hydrolase family 127 protein [Bacteroidales bacterium]|nr:glycoside hydrolase family 127 protein [Bacteroidales bacterium]